MSDEPHLSSWRGSKRGASPLYQEAGARVLTDAELEAALAAWKADHPGERTYAGIEARLRHLNAEAKERAEAEAAGTTVRMLRQVRAEAKAREAAARDARDLAAARIADGVQEAPASPAPSQRGYPSLEQIEAERRKLAVAGKPHGYDALGGRGPGHPFPGQRSTIVRRYATLAPPGTAIPGFCEHAPPHSH